MLQSVRSKPHSKSYSTLPFSAETARAWVLMKFHLKFLLLFCEYGLRTDDNTLVFMLIGCCYRMIRMLQLDTEPSTDHSKAIAPDVLTQHENRRRLVWSCFTLDASISASLSANICWANDRPRIALPCRETDFLQQTPSEPLYLDSDGLLAHGATAAHEIRGQALQLMHLRKKVLE